MRTCVICEAIFEPRTSRIITCSPACSAENACRKERLRQPPGSRSKPPSLLVCCVCGCEFESKRCDKKFCSSKCNYQSKAERRREMCRDWRRRNPDKQRESSRKWEKNNRENHLEIQRRSQIAFHKRNPEYRAEQSSRYRQTYPEKIKAYTAIRTASYQLVRLIEVHGLDALKPDFEKPKPSKQAEYSRQWKKRNPDYKNPRKRENARDAGRKHNQRESAAVKLVREIETKGLEALL